MKGLRYPPRHVPPAPSLGTMRKMLQEYKKNEQDSPCFHLRSTASTPPPKQKARHPRISYNPPLPQNNPLLQKEKYHDRKKITPSHAPSR